MEGQPHVEPRNQDQADGQRETAEDEWRSWQRGQVRNTLHLVSAAAQWILLLTCLIYLGIDSLRPSTPWSDKAPWTLIRYTGKSDKGVALNLTAELGSIQIRNGSIMITCDGLYLMSLNGSIYPNPELEMKLLKTDKTSSIPIWEKTLQKDISVVNFTTVLYLFDQDSITLWTSSNATISDLSLSLTLQRPFTCV